METNIQRPPIYTIGYGNRHIDRFIDLLKYRKIEYLIDVRSSPRSGYNPDFSGTQLEKKLPSVGIKYVFMGEELGGRPSDPNCYTEDGKVDYEKTRQSRLFQSGMERLFKANHDQRLTLVLMCSELRPEDCHRSKMIGEELALEGWDFDVKHIDEEGEIKSQSDVINVVYKQLGLDKPQQMPLPSFSDPNIETTSRPKLTSKRVYLNLNDHE
jgi:uncharacterized protein (DUF488 family)